MLKGKKCPRPGIPVVAKGTLVGTTTGDCERKRVEVRVPGFGTGTFTRSELRALGRREQKNYAEVTGRLVGGVQAARPAAAMVAQHESVLHIPSESRGHDPYEGMNTSEPAANYRSYRAFDGLGHDDQSSWDDDEPVELAPVWRGRTSRWTSEIAAEAYERAKRAAGKTTPTFEGRSRSLPSSTRYPITEFSGFGAIGPSGRSASDMLVQRMPKVPAASASRGWTAMPGGERKPVQVLFHTSGERNRRSMNVWLQGLLERGVLAGSFVTPNEFAAAIHPGWLEQLSNVEVPGPGATPQHMESYVSRALRVPEFVRMRLAVTVDPTTLVLERLPEERVVRPVKPRDYTGTPMAPELREERVRQAMAAMAAEQAAADAANVARIAREEAAMAAHRQKLVERARLAAEERDRAAADFEARAPRIEARMAEKAAANELLRRQFAREALTPSMPTFSPVVAPPPPAVTRVAPRAPRPAPRGRIVGSGVTLRRK